jgi:NAD(P)H-quinone oxidoreductase subunit 5
MHYLDGERHRRAYVGWFLATVAAAMVLVLSNNLLLLALAWCASSLFLHQLLTFFKDRPQAIIAAHKKFLLSRVADLAIFSAVALTGWRLGTFQIDQVLAQAATLPAMPASLVVAGLLLAVGVILRSAQLPFHGWLIQVMEAPTPVSALLHAGIVNIGGVVLIRLAPMMSRLEAAQTLLVVSGTLTAVLAALVMTSRISVKVGLAWSTAAQMGFMLIELGLGAYGLALLQSQLPSLPAPGLGRWIGAAALGMVLVAAVGRVAGLSITEPGLPAVGVILALALTPLFVNASLLGARPLATAVGLGVALTLLYAGWHTLFSSLVPSLGTGSTAEMVRVGLVVAGFLALFGVHTIVSSYPGGSLARALYPACHAGFYLDELFTRLTFKLWPPRPAPARSGPPWRSGTFTLERAA